MNCSRKTKLLATLIVATMPSGVWAGHGHGKVGRIGIGNDAPVVLFDLSSQVEEPPRCNELGRFAIDLRKPGGRSSYEALLLAKERDLAVTVTGLNTCKAYRGTEDIRETILK